MSDFADKIVKQIVAAQKQDVERCLSTAHGDAFDFGRACGIQQAYKNTLMLIEILLKDPEERPDTLARSLRRAQRGHLPEIEETLT